jgi:hypothetical protein
MTNKTVALSAIEEMSNSVTLAEIQYKLYVIEKIQKAKRDVRKNGVVDSESARKIAAKWK